MRDKCFLQHPGAHAREEYIPGLACTACGATGGTGGMAEGAEDGGGGGGAAATASAAGGGAALAAATAEETEVKKGKCSLDLMISKNISFASKCFWYCFLCIYSRFSAAYVMHS